MSEPKFKVGEEIILQSKNQPESNGEYTVIDVITDGKVFECRITGNKMRRTGRYGVGYMLDGAIAKGESGMETSWAESALRKKYPPSEYSYTELMDKLKEKEHA